MSTTLYNAFTKVAADMGDYTTATTTSAGDSTSVISTELCVYSDDWIPQGGGWVILTEEPAGDAVIYDERKVTLFTSATGDLTTLAFAAAPGSGIDFAVTRLFSPSNYRKALISAAMTGFPYIHKHIYDATVTIDANEPYADISDLGLAQHRPYRVDYCEDTTADYPIWCPVRNYSVTEAGVMYLPPNLPESTLRIEGIGYLDFLKADAVSTDWDAAIALDEPQIKILSAEAAVYLYSQMAGTYASGGQQYATERLQYWIAERQKRIASFSLPLPKIRTNFGVR